MSRHSDLDHIQTPPDERGAQWWLAEHAQAEQAVTSAADMVERSRGKYMHDVATTLLETSGPRNDTVIKRIAALDGVFRARMIPGR